MKKFLFVFLILLPLQAAADSWVFPKGKTVESFSFGDISVDRVVDARKNRRYPDFYINVRKGNKLISSIKGASFSNIYASEKNEYFLALSNDGLPGSAIVVFSANGSVLMHLTHGMLSPDYCQMSVSRARVWYDADHPEVTFEYYDAREGKVLDDAKIKLCNGKYVLLTELIDGIGERNKAKKVGLYFFE
jgi:hypothetical protein